MGSVVASAVAHIAEPTVGLLNVGEEEVKGNELVKETGALLETYKGLRYIGFVEGDDVFKGTADVVVCDGFVGNVMLKTTEGVLKMLSKYVKEAFTKNLLSKISALAVLHILKRIGKSLDPSEYNGATLLGLNGIVVKSHGSANKKAFLSAIREALEEVEHGVADKIRDGVEAMLATREQ